MIDELKEILRLLDRFVGHYPIYLCLVDADNTVIWFNRFMASQLPGIHAGQKLSCRRALWPCDPLCEECRPSGEEYSELKVERHLLKTPAGAGGAQKVLEFFNFPVQGKSGEFHGVLRIGMDVTAGERLQEKLRSKEKLFTAIVDTSADGIIFWNNEEQVVSWNKGAEEIFGYTAEEMIGRPITDLVPSELIELGELNYIRKELSSRGLLKKYETQRRHKDGHVLYVDISSTRIYDESGQPLGTSEIIKDIDSRKELEFELLRTILELSKLNELNEILHKTYDEEEILRIVLIAITAGEGLRFNRAFVLLSDPEEGLLRGHLAIGPSNQEEANRIWTELDQDNHYLKDIVRAYKIDLEGIDKGVNEIVRRIRVPLENHENALVSAFEKRRVLRIKSRNQLGEGENDFSVGEATLFDLLQNDDLVITPLFTKKERLGLIIADNCINRRKITTEDVEGLKLFASQAGSAIENARLYRTLEERIVDLKEAYRRLEENQQKLLQSERLAAIGEMSAKVAHEIRNPLVSIGGFARLIERKQLDPEKLNQYAAIIREQVDNLEVILTNILSTARPPQPDRQMVNLNDIVEEVVAMLEGATRARHIQVTVNLCAEAPWVEGDRKLLSQALLNIFRNAIDALDQRDEDRQIHLETTVQENQAEISVRDNGRGMDDEVRSKIFESFFTTKSSGTGLGLSIVRQIVDAHVGKIEVISCCGEGSTFRIKFSAAAADKLTALPRRSKPAGEKVGN